MDIQIATWSDFKADIIAKGFTLNYVTDRNSIGEFRDYRVFAIDRSICWIVVINSSSDVLDFETNYKVNCNKCIYDAEGKEFNRAESRPLTCTTCFTTCGDTLGSTPSIGTGDRLGWDASVDTFTTVGAPTGYKQKKITIQFCDSIWLKEGSLYYMNATKGSYVDMEVLCPNDSYFMCNGAIAKNTTGEDLVVDHYLCKHPIQDNVPMGDELNTESCSQELPSYLKFRMTITVPTSDTTSYGYMEVEVYRQRTVVIAS